MSKWQDIEIPEKKEPYKQNLKYRQTYNDYGFTDFNGMYSLVEENRDFRQSIQEEIVVESIKAQNKLGGHVTDETDRNISEVDENTNARATEIKQKIQEHHNYVVNTVYPKIQTVDTKVDTANSKADTIITKVDNSRGVIDQIWNKVKGWSW